MTCHSNQILQALCRKYLKQLELVADKYGMGDMVRELRKDNERERCVATKEEVEMLSRAVDKERVTRAQIPKILGKSYRQCCDDEDFEKIEKLPRSGIYSRISTLLYKHRKND